MSKKRYRAPVAKPGELLVKFGRLDGELDLLFCYGGSGASSRDSHVLLNAIGRAGGLNGLSEKSLRQELEDRGYDIETLRFSIKKKAQAQAQKP